MALTYADWASPDYDTRTQYDRLCRHIAELGASGIGVGDVNSDGKGRANFSAVVNMKNLLDQKEAYERALGIGLSAAMVSRVDVRRGSR